MRGNKSRVKLLIALSILVLSPMSLVLRAQATTPTLSTNADTFKIGETVSFSGENYEPVGSTYRLNITYGSVVYSVLEFVSTDSSGIPEGVSWVVPAGVPSGTYLATVYNITDPTNSTTYNQEVANKTFLVNAGSLVSDKFEYFVDEPVEFSGEGYTPEGTNYTLEIVLNGTVVATVPFTSNGNGSIPDGVFWQIPFDAGNGTCIATSYNNTTPSIGTALATTEFFINATEAGRIGAITEELEQLTETINSSVEDVNVSLIQKLNVTARKVDQAITWLGQGKTKVATNMLNAARNALEAFIHEVEAQRGKHIDEEIADQLIGEANAIIAKIDLVIPSTSHSGDKGQGHQLEAPPVGQHTTDDEEPKGKGKNNGKGKGSKDD
jgi:hypothetical protein